MTIDLSKNGDSFLKRTELFANNTLWDMNRKLLPYFIVLSVLVVGICSDSLRGENSSSDRSLKSLAVFPGAFGFGTTTPAGRGGKIVRVNNLNNAGPGSLRAALAIPGPKFVVFEIGGIITLTSDLKISTPFLTLAGQTAPSPGITLIGAGIRVLSHDILIQHLRLRVGDNGSGPSPMNRDALQILGKNSFNILIDHVSLSWAIDENLSLWGGSHDVTISNCIVSFALHRSLHPKGAHSTGLLIGDGSKRVAVIRNVLAHNNSRNPRIKGDTSALIVNNLIYNGRGYLTIGSRAGPALVSAIGNVFIAGVDTPASTFAINLAGGAARGTKVYVRDNYYRGRIVSMLNKYLASYQPPIWCENLPVMNHNKVPSFLLAGSGARPVERDALDRIFEGALTAPAHKVIDRPQFSLENSDVGPSHRPFIEPHFSHADDDGDGYTNIEELLHRMAFELERIPR